MNASISVLILTYNEEKCIATALRSVADWSNDVVVLDSCSTDDTERIVRGFPHVRFHTNKFIDFSAQRNYGLHEIRYKNDWVFMLDADEACSPELMREMLLVVSRGDKSIGSYMMRRKDIIAGQWVRIHYSVWFERLVQPHMVRFEGPTHEKVLTDCKKGEIRESFHHYPFNNGIHRWICRHSAYAKAMAELETCRQRPIALADIVHRDPQKRQNALKALYQRLPGRWVIYFVYKLIFNKGILYGAKGITFVALETIYHYLVTVYVKELRRNAACKS